MFWPSPRGLFVSFLQMSRLHIKPLWTEPEWSSLRQLEICVTGRRSKATAANSTRMWWLKDTWVRQEISLHWTNVLLFILLILFKGGKQVNTIMFFFSSLVSVKNNTFRCRVWHRQEPGSLRGHSLRLWGVAAPGGSDGRKPQANRHDEE